MNNTSLDAIQSPKTISIISYLTIFGWIVGMILNSNNRSELGSFHVRQALGLHLLLFIARFLIGMFFIFKVVGALAIVAIIVLGFIGIMDAVKERQEPVPFVGEYFQEWFRAI